MVFPGRDLIFSILQYVSLHILIRRRLFRIVFLLAGFVLALLLVVDGDSFGKCVCRFLQVSYELPLWSHVLERVLYDEVNVHRQRILRPDVVLQESEKEIKLLARVSAVETHTTRIQDCAY